MLGLALLLSCSIGTESDTDMVRDTGEVLGRNDSLATKGWSASGEMATGNVGKKVSLQAVFSKPENYTVQFQLVAIDEPKGGIGPFWAPLQAQARISWSVEGNTVERLVSVSDGMAVTGAGQGIRVVIEDATSGIGTATVLGRRYRVAISVAPGTRGADSIPPILLTSNVPLSTAVGATATIPVPQRAGVKSVLVTVATIFGTAIPSGGARVFQQYDDAAGNLAVYDPREVNGFCPLLPGVTNILVQNNGVADTIVWAVIFGIDG